MRQATSQEPVSDSGHSLILETSESNGNSGLKSAAMLGIALSVGASGALIPSPEAAAVVNVPTKAATTEAFSSNTQVATASDATAVQQIVGYHTVASGESLWQIAQQYRVGLQDLKSANALSPETSISVGQVLKVPAGTALRTTNGATNELAQTEGIKIASAEVNTVLDADVRPLATANHSPVSEMAVTPAPAVKVADASVAATQSESAEVTAPVVTAYAPTPETSSYRVQSGDTLRSIASSLGTTPDAIVRANSLINPDVIFVGSTLVVPVSQSAPQPAIAKANQPATAESTRVLAEIRTAGPEEALSVGGEELTKQDLLGSIQGREGRDPYVANLLAEVEEVRN
ncbi:MAG: LysM peptidoglycan-binding domain-containing protein, partial [Phormidesmis sp.]